MITIRKHSHRLSDNSEVFQVAVRDTEDGPYSGCSIDAFNEASADALMEALAPVIRRYATDTVKLLEPDCA